MAVYCIVHSVIQSCIMYVFVDYFLAISFTADEPFFEGRHPLCVGQAGSKILCSVYA